MEAIAESRRGRKSCYGRIVICVYEVMGGEKREEWEKRRRGQGDRAREVRRDEAEGAAREGKGSDGTREGGDRVWRA